MAIGNDSSRERCDLISPEISMTGEERKQFRENTIMRDKRRIARRATHV
jgi:hypothetical protein